MAATEERRLWQRGEEPGFSRIAFFTDAVFAIAMTLLVLDVRLPELGEEGDDAGAMWDALTDLGPRLVSFAIAFYVLGIFWLAGHSLVGRLGKVDRRFMGITLLYLGLVAFTPFPTSLIGQYEGNPLSGVLFALDLAALSGILAVQLWWAHRADLLDEPLSGPAFRHHLLGAAHSGIVFLVTLPLSLIDPTVMLATWVVLLPVTDALSDRWPRGWAQT